MSAVTTLPSARLFLTETQQEITQANVHLATPLTPVTAHFPFRASEPHRLAPFRFGFGFVRSGNVAVVCIT